MKTCTKCNEPKPEKCFAFRKDRGMHYSICRECFNAHARSKYDPLKGRAACKAYRERYPEKAKAKNDRRDPEVLRQSSKRWHEKNPGAGREQQRKARNEVSKWYAAKTLGLRATDVPAEFLEAKRQHLLLVRAIKELKK
jgi:hypothetical protein